MNSIRVVKKLFIQRDHGPWLQPRHKRLWILNAYQLPGHNAKLYPTITPVNTFRLVCEAYFGAGNKSQCRDAVVGDVNA